MNSVMNLLVSIKCGEFLEYFHKKDPVPFIYLSISFVT